VGCFYGKNWVACFVGLIIYSPDVMWQKIRYIHLNPARAGIVGRAEDYTYSNASNYAEKGGLIDVILMDEF